MTTLTKTDTLATRLEIAQQEIARCLELAGWEMRAVEIDLHRATARIEVKSFDGRLVTLDVRRGRATLTREQIEHRVSIVGRRGDRCPVERITTTFLGRQYCGSGVRSGLRAFCDYLSANAPSGLLRHSARAAFGQFLSLAAQSPGKETLPRRCLRAGE